MPMPSAMLAENVRTLMQQGLSEPDALRRAQQGGGMASGSPLSKMGTPPPPQPSGQVVTPMPSSLQGPPAGTIPPGGVSGAEPVAQPSGRSPIMERLLMQQKLRQAGATGSGPPGRR